MVVQSLLENDRCCSYFINKDESIIDGHMLKLTDAFLLALAFSVVSSALQVAILSVDVLWRPENSSSSFTVNT